MRFYLILVLSIFTQSLWGNSPSFAGIRLGSSLKDISKTDGVKLGKTENFGDYCLTEVNLNSALSTLPIKSLKLFTTVNSKLVYKLEVIFSNNQADSNWSKMRFVCIAEKIKSKYGRFKNDGGKSVEDLYPSAELLKNDFNISLTAPNIFGLVTDFGEIKLTYKNYNLIDKAQKEVNLNKRLQNAGDKLPDL